MAQTFVELQERRHLADYDLSWSVTRAQTLGLVQQADQARMQFENWNDRDMKKFFLACLMTWKVLAHRG